MKEWRNSTEDNVETTIQGFAEYFTESNGQQISAANNCNGYKKTKKQSATQQKVENRNENKTIICTLQATNWGNWTLDDLDI